MAKTNPPWVPKDEAVNNQQPEVPPVDQKADSRADEIIQEIQDKSVRQEDDVKRQITNVFANPPASKNPFAPDPKKAAHAEQVEMFDVPKGTPGWGEFAAFVMKYGDKIVQTRYPNPRGPVVETVWKGIRVHNHPTCQLQHAKYGWLDWSEIQDE